MDEAKREEIALLRYGMILPFLSPDKLDWGLKSELRRWLAQEHHLSEDTIRKWLAPWDKAFGDPVG